MTQESIPEVAEAQSLALEAPRVEDKPDKHWWLAPLASVAAGLIAISASLWVYHSFFAYKPMKLAVLDINFIMEAKELQFTAMLSQPGVTDVERKSALALVAQIEPELKRVLTVVRKECGCEILVKAAVLSSDHIPDITSTVAERMNINAETVGAAKRQLREALEKSKPQEGSK